MNVLTSVIELKNESGVEDVEEFLTRVDSMHDVFTADPTVVSADIFSDNGSEIGIMLKMHSLPGEEQSDVNSRTDELCDAAFAKAHIQVSERVEAEAGTKVREFALV